MTSDTENLGFRHPSHRGGVWGSLATFPFFLTLIYIVKIAVDQYGGNAQTLLPLWIWSIGSALASILIGGIWLSGRAVLMTVAVLLGLFMLRISLVLLSEQEDNPYWDQIIESGGCAGGCLVALCSLSLRERLLTWARHPFLFRVFLVIALSCSIFYVRMEFYQVFLSQPWLFLFVMTPWASVMLARQVSKNALLDEILSESSEEILPADPGEESVTNDCAPPGTNPRV